LEHNVTCETKAVDLIIIIANAFPDTITELGAVQANRAVIARRWITCPAEAVRRAVACCIRWVKGGGGKINGGGARDIKEHNFHPWTISWWLPLPQPKGWKLGKKRERSPGEAGKEEERNGKI
jgi:hypothetical protein